MNPYKHTITRTYPNGEVVVTHIDNTPYTEKDDQDRITYQKGNGWESWSGFDERGNVILSKTIQPATGNSEGIYDESVFKYDENDNMIYSKCTSNGVVSVYVAEFINDKLIRSFDDGKLTRENEYNDNGILIKETRYDEEGISTSEWHPDGSLTDTYESVDKQHKTITEYNKFDQVTSTTHISPASTVIIEQQYDDHGRYTFRKEKEITAEGMITRTTHGSRLLKLETPEYTETYIYGE